MKKVILNNLKKKVMEGQSISIKLMGYSMYPTIYNGDGIVIEPYNFYDIKENDIVAIYYNNADHFIVHRVIKIEESNGGKFLITKGDNNPYIDARVVKKKNFVGIVNMKKDNSNIYELNRDVYYIKDRHCVIKYAGELKDVSYVMPKTINRRKININRSLTTELIVLLSYRCNLNCIYCSNDSGQKDKLKEVVDEDNIVKAISFVVKNAVLLRSINKGKNTKPARIIVSGGGEPTIEWKLIRLVVDTINKFRKQYGDSIAQLIILTNAQCDEFKTDYLINEFDNIAISCDGFSVQDIQRPRVDGKSSVEYVKKILDKLSLMNKKTSIRMTVTGEALSRLYDDIKYIIDNYNNVKDIVIEPYVQVGRGKNGNVAELDYEEFVRKFDKIAGEYYEYVYNSATILEYANMYPCQRLSGVSIVLSPYNVITCCDTVTADSELWEQMLISTLENEMEIKKKYEYDIPKECSSCIAELFCAGGCPMQINNLDNEEKKTYCLYRQQMMRDELLRRLELSKKTKEYDIKEKKCMIYELPRGGL